MPQALDFNLLCICSGPAVQRAAIQAAKLGKRTAMVEQLLIFGGVCIDTGMIPSKTFREAVLSFVAQDSPFEGHHGHHLSAHPTAVRHGGLERLRSLSPGR